MEKVDPIKVLAFFRSVVKSGETWTPTCEEHFDGAVVEIESLRARVAELEADKAMFLECKRAAVYAYIAVHREGWEEGISAEAAWGRVSDCLGNLGLMDMKEIQAWAKGDNAAREGGGRE